MDWATATVCNRQDPKRLASVPPDGIVGNHKLCHSMIAAPGSSNLGVDRFVEVNAL
jgi:hypothetical protein